MSLSYGRTVNCGLAFFHSFIDVDIKSKIDTRQAYCSKELAKNKD